MRESSPELIEKTGAFAEVVSTVNIAGGEPASRGHLSVCDLSQAQSQAV